MHHSEICVMLRRKGSSTDAKRTHVQEKEDSILNEYIVLFDNRKRKTFNEMGMVHSVRNVTEVL
jgi:hypothetical protein